MKQGEAKAKSTVESTRMRTPAKSIKSAQGLLTKSEMAEKETEASTEFLVGALLYSLFASHRSEMIHGLLPNDENN